jgi:hypothetical protein
MVEDFRSYKREGNSLPDRCAKHGLGHIPKPERTVGSGVSWKKVLSRRQDVSLSMV